MICKCLPNEKINGKITSKVSALLAKRVLTGKAEKLSDKRDGRFIYRKIKKGGKEQNMEEKAIIDHALDSWDRAIIGLEVSAFELATNFMPAEKIKARDLRKIEGVLKEEVEKGWAIKTDQTVKSPLDKNTTLSVYRKINKNGDLRSPVSSPLTNSDHTKPKESEEEIDAFRMGEMMIDYILALQKEIGDLKKEKENISQKNIEQRAEITQLNKDLSDTKKEMAKKLAQNEELEKARKEIQSLKNELEEVRQTFMNRKKSLLKISDSLEKFKSDG